MIDSKHDAILIDFDRFDFYFDIKITRLNPMFNISKFWVTQIMLRYYNAGNKK